MSSGNLANFALLGEGCNLAKNLLFQVFFAAFFMQAYTLLISKKRKKSEGSVFKSVRFGMEWPMCFSFEGYAFGVGRS